MFLFIKTKQRITLKTLNSDRVLNEKVQLPTKMDSILTAEKKVEQICEALNVAERCVGNILISVTEAVNNAIVHGNNKDETKQIYLTCSTSNNNLIFTIKDEGAGFDSTNLPDPTDPENLEKLHGRGVFLMRNLADQVDFEEEGKLVKLTFLDYAND